MTRTTRSVRNAFLGLAGLLLIAAVAVPLIIRTDWFRNYVRQQIIESTADATGGRVEIKSFSFDVSSLHAVITDFIVHGTEPADAQPLARVARVEIHFRLFTNIHHLLDIAYLGIDRPQFNVIRLPGGQTNIPAPKHKSAAGKSALENVVDLTIGHFALRKGMALFDSRSQPLDIDATNFRAQLDYNVLTQGYQGQLQLEPVYVASGRNTPVTFVIKIPLAVQRDRVDFHHATLTTPLSAITVDGSFTSMASPRVNAHLNGYLATADIQNITNQPPARDSKNVPATLELDANAAVSSDVIDVTGIRLTFGHSTFEGSGRLKDPNGKAALQFKTQLALGELGRLAKLVRRPEGTLTANGIVRMDAANNYDVAGNIQARAISFEQDKRRIANITASSAIHFDPHTLELQGLKLDALGGEFDGNVSLADFQRYKVQGALRNLDVGTAARTFGATFPWEGVLAGTIDAQGDTRASKAADIVASARLAITPGTKGIPVSGRLNANYNGATDTVAIQNSFLALPHSRLTLDGSLGRQLNIVLTTRDLSDFVSGTHVALNGEATFTAAVTGRFTSPKISGHVSVNQFTAEGRRFDGLSADVAAAENSAALSNSILTRGPMKATFTASAGLRDWAALPREPLVANVSITGGDLADAMALAEQPPAGYSGSLTAAVRIQGTIGNPQGAANLQLANGTIAGEPFDQLQAQVNLGDQLVTIPTAYIQSGASRASLSGEFHHPRDSFTIGTLHAHLLTNQIDLARRPNTAGTAQIDADLDASIDQNQILVTSLNAGLNARGLRLNGQSLGDVTATAKTTGRAASYQLTSNFAGSNIQITGTTQLTRDYPTAASATIANLPVDRVLTAAKYTDLDARGTLSGTARLTGSYSNPQGTADLVLDRAVLSGEPLDRVHASFIYRAQSIDVPQFEVIAGAARINLKGRFDHPSSDFQHGTASFTVTSSHLDLSRIHNVQSRRPGLGGSLDLNASGELTLQSAAPRILFTSLNANLAVNGIAAGGRNYGNLKLTAATTAGNHLNVAFDSNLADAAIHGEGTATLAGDYPVDARVTFSNAAWTRLRGLLNNAASEPSPFEATTEGDLSISGPVLKTDQLSGAIHLNKLNLTSLPRSAVDKSKTVAIGNQGPVAVTLDHGTLRVDSAHLTGPQTDIQLTGTGSLKDQSLDAGVSATIDVGLLQSFDRGIYSTGKIVVAATVRGSMSEPLVNGQTTVQNATFNYAELPLGISNANGTIAFSGNTARIQKLTADAGGGHLDISGFAGYSDGLRFGLRAGATGVRLRVQQGVSINGDADIRLTGTLDDSLVSGTATVNQVTYAPHSDLGSILVRAGPPVQAPSISSPLLDNMKLDIRVRTSASLGVQASLAENLQADADLRVRGTAAQPGVLGRATITEGQLVFFGAEYAVDTGTIAFYNPIRIEPILDISLETQAKGVTVTLRVTGPVDNMKLSYSSDPPLQFQEIVSLLASGKTPTTDPTLLANQPQQAAQGFQQMGESAILGTALTDPVAGRLQRVFGVTQLKIDPSFTTGSNVPTANLTLQQRITSNLTFTYVSAVNDPNGTIIRVEWAFNPQYSAVATRDQNGIVSLTFFYKRQFR